MCRLVKEQFGDWLKPIPKVELNLSKRLEKGTLTVWNNGNVSISGFYIKVIPINGLMYSEGNPADEPRNLNWIFHTFKFKELLTKNGFVKIDISPLIAKCIKESYGKFDKPDDIFIINFNIVISPIEEGKEIAVDSSNYGSNDRSLISTRIRPKLFLNADIGNLIAKMDTEIRVFGGH